MSRARIVIELREDDEIYDIKNILNLAQVLCASLPPNDGPKHAYDE